MRRAAFLTLVLLLAGCSDAPEGTSDEGADLPDMDRPQQDAGPTLVAVSETIPISFDGSLGTLVHGCVFPASFCTPPTEVQPGSEDLILERPGSNLTDLAFDVTWTAQTPATQTLSIGVMAMATCDGCPDAFENTWTGTSPMRIELTGLAVPLNESMVVHVYVYNPQGFVYNDAVPAYALASVAQAYHIEGTATVQVLVPAPATSPSGPAA